MAQGKAEILPPDASPPSNGRFAAGHHGPGRPKGSVNKVGASIKQMVLDALEQAGGTNYLLYQATVNPQLFMPLIGKVLPLQVDVGGEINIQHHYIARKSVAPPKKK